MGWAVLMQHSGCLMFISEPLLCMRLHTFQRVPVWLWKQWSQQTAHAHTHTIWQYSQAYCAECMIASCGCVVQISINRLHNSDLIFRVCLGGIQPPTPWGMVCHSTLAFPCHLQNTHGTDLHCVFTECVVRTSGFLQKHFVWPFWSSDVGIQTGKNGGQLGTTPPGGACNGNAVQMLAPWPPAYTSFMKRNCSRFRIVFKVLKRLELQNHLANAQSRLGRFTPLFPSGCKILRIKVLFLPSFTSWLVH